MKDLPDALTGLAERLDNLERRVCALEHAQGADSQTVQGERRAGAVAEAAADSGGELSQTITTGAFSLLGKAMLGIAGAYLLRAVAESGVAPSAGVAAVAIAYAIAWLAGAARTKADAWLASTIYACTSALILAPMLWELTLRFKVLPEWATAAVLCGFVIAAAGLTWKREIAPVLWVSYVTAAGIALSLAISSHQWIPFVVVLLLMELVTEGAAVLKRGRGVRIVTALAADFAVWALIYVYSGPQNAEDHYPTLNAAGLIVPGAALFAICGASLVLRIVVNGDRITWFDTIQATIAFLLAACGVIYFGPAQSAIGLGGLCVLLSVGCYAVALVRFDPARQERNSRVFGLWSGALFLAGSLMCLPAMSSALWLGTAAVAASVAGARLKRISLAVHGTAFILTAAAISGTASEVWSALAGTIADGPAWGVYFISICVVLVYAAFGARSAGSWKEQGLRLLIAGCVAAMAAALIVQALVDAAAVRVVPGAHHVAFLRTFTVCLLAIALAYSGSRWKRIELTRIGYGALVLLAVKLIIEDLRHGHLAYVAGSIFLFAITLIAVPRAARAGQRALH